MSRKYTFPGYNDDHLTAEQALQEWIDTFDYGLSDDEQEALFEFTRHDMTADFNIEALKYGADYAGLDLEKLGYPLPVEATS